MMTAQGALAEVRFVAEFEAPGAQDPSRLIVDFTMGPLITYGVRCGTPRYVQDGSAFHCVVGERTFEVIVASRDEAPNTWRMEIWSGLSWIKRRLRARDDAELMHLSRALHKILTTSSRMSEISWHGFDGMQARPDREWWHRGGEAA